MQFELEIDFFNREKKEEEEGNGKIEIGIALFSDSRQLNTVLTVDE